MLIDVCEQLRDSLRSGQLFERHDEPLDDYGKRVVRVILAERQRTGFEANEQIAALRAERDKWLKAFNESEQFQDGPTKRAEAAEAQLTALQAEHEQAGQMMAATVGLASQIQRELHDKLRDAEAKVASLQAEQEQWQKKLTRFSTEMREWQQDEDAGYDGLIDVSHKLWQEILAALTAQQETEA